MTDVPPLAQPPVPLGDDGADARAPAPLPGVGELFRAFFSMALHGFGGVLNRTLGQPQICSELVTNIKGKVEFACAIVYLLEDNETTLVPHALCDPEHPMPLAGNFLKHTPAGLELSTRTVAGWVAQTGKIVRVDDTLTDSRCVEIGQGMRSVLAVPLRGRQSAIGVIQLEHPHPHAYNASDERILASLANQAAI